MAGTINLSLSQQFDKYGAPLSGGKLYFYAAGTTTPQNAFSDSGLTNALPNPIILDEAGRVPQFFLADGSIKVRLISFDGISQINADNLLVVGPSSGTGGGGGTVDATTIFETGDIKARYGTGTKDGWVRLNGKTIGSSTSGATERANADCQALFEYLYGVDANLAVSTGRGASAAADWVANKTIALPNFQGSYLAFFDGMGNTKANKLTSSYLGVDADTIGLIPTPSQSRTLITANLPPYTPSGEITIIQNNGDPDGALDGQTLAFSSSTFRIPFWDGTAGGQNPLSLSAEFSGDAQGGTSTPVGILPPTAPLVTAYMKL